MVPLTKGQECSEEMITRSVFVVVRRFTQVVSNGINAERRLEEQKVIIR